tara:strand:+ start:1180 stop:1743 length:564 start_codon:yes stop_codon:yes gene_type:complete
LLAIEIVIKLFSGVNMISINEVLLDILMEKNLQSFSVNELKKMFIAVVPGVDNRQLSQLIHRTLSKLCKHGFVEKTINVTKASYRKTTFFDASKLSKSKSRIHLVEAETEETEETKDKIHQLKATLNKYQVDLMGFIGEAEEFKRIFSEFPEAKPELYTKYMDARNQSSTIIGKIKALEACLNVVKG